MEIDKFSRSTKMSLLLHWRTEEKYYEGQIVEILQDTDLWLWRIGYEDGDAEWLNHLKIETTCTFQFQRGGWGGGGGHRQQFVPLDKVQNGTRVWVWWDKYKKYYEVHISDLESRRKWRR